MELFYGKISNLTEEEYSNAFALMSDLRKAEVERMRFEGDKKRSVLGEWLARKAVSALCGLSEKDILFAKTENGKPYCLNAETFFSISHCKDMAVCVAHNGEIGIDVELIRDIDYRITRFACVDADLDYLNSAESEEEKQLRFFRIWTAKEAYVKYIGTGIRDLKTISYAEIAKHCQTRIEDGYMITVYCE